MDLGFFNKYPYTDFHELNLDWIIEALKRYTKELQDFVQINAIKYADPIQWDIQRQYEKNTVVIDPLNGTAYISVQAVPAGISLSRPEYWSVIFDLSLFITAANNNFTVRVEPTAATTATFATAAGEWLVWDQKLYKADVNITAGDAYVEGSNITRWTVEEGLQDTNAALAAISTAVGNLADLTTTDKTSIVNAINDVVAALTIAVNNIGDLTSLTTLDRSSLVNAINELVTNIAGIISDIGDLTNLTTVDQSSIVNAINELATNIAGLVTDMGSLADLTTTDKSSIVNAINELVTSVGDLANLTTTDKSSLVNAINELVSIVTSITSDIGDLADLNTTDKSNIVNAINELVGTIPASSDFVTPEQFGAAGDGVTDDTQAVIDAADYAVNNSKTLYMSADYMTDASCILQGNTSIIITGHVSNLWLRNAYAGIYLIKNVDTLKITSIKNSTFILGEIQTMQLISSESLNTMINAGIAYNTFVGGYAAYVTLTGSTANEWINENKWYGTRMISVTITGGYPHNNNIFDDVTIEGGSINLTNARSNHFKIRGESGYTLNADPDSFNNIIETTYAINNPLSFALSTPFSSDNGNLETTSWIYRYNRQTVFAVTNANFWSNDNDYSTGQVKTQAWNAMKTKKIMAKYDCIFHVTCDVACMRPHFRLYKNGSVVLTRSNAVDGLGLNFNTSTGYYSTGSNTADFWITIAKSTDFDEIEFDAYPSTTTLIREMKCDVFTIGTVFISPDEPNPLKSATKPTNATAPYGTYVANSTGSGAGWIRTSTDWQAVTVS